jgi:hypothetical protein
MWNFVGRQSDNQGRYGTQEGNWLSGVTFIDELHLGSQDIYLATFLTTRVATFISFTIPFRLNWFNVSRYQEYEKFYVLLALFLFTGFALKIYLNETFEPRERDYALVGSFYVFAIWIGFECIHYTRAYKILSSKICGSTILLPAYFAAPVLMASQNWDDHDRSGNIQH